MSVTSLSMLQCLLEHLTLSFRMMCRLQDQLDIDEHLMLHVMDLSLAAVQTAAHAAGTQAPRLSGMKVLLLSFCNVQTVSSVEVASALLHVQLQAVTRP